MRTQRRSLLISLAALSLAPPASAQYSFDPANADEQAKPGTLYFGSSKDENGRYVPSVTVFLEAEQMSSVLITDAQGRFHARLLLDAPSAKVRARCAKPGYALVRVSRRPGPAGGRASLQIDCTLRRKGAR